MDKEYWSTCKNDQWFQRAHKQVDVQGSQLRIKTRKGAIYMRGSAMEFNLWTK